METLFAQRVRARMAELGIEQDNQLAAGLAGRMGLKVETVVTKLSKLVRGDPEAQRQLLRDDRLAAWGEELQVETTTLRGCLEESRGRLDLILDPRLPVNAREFIEKKADGRRYHVVENGEPPSSEAEIQEWLRDHANIAISPLIVLADLDGKDFFDGAQLPVTTVYSQPLGWVLRDHPELVPLDDPPPPKLRDEDGRPLFPSEALAKKWLHGRPPPGVLSGKKYKEVERTLAQGGTPSFPLADVLRPLVRERIDDLGVPNRWSQDVLGPHSKVQLITLPPTGREVTDSGRDSDDAAKRLHEERSSAVFKALNGETEETYIWLHGDRYFAAGPETARLTGLFAPHHPDAGCHPLQLPEPARSDLERRNLWRATDAEWWQAARESVLAETGLDIDGALDDLRQLALTPTEDDHTVLLEGEDLDRAREVVAHLATRAVRGDSLLPLRLAQLARAPLMFRPKAPRETLHVIGYLGRGRLLELRLLQFEEEPEPLAKAPNADPDESTELGWWDGADARVFLDASIDRHLGPLAG